MQQGVSAGYAQWAEQTVADAAPDTPAEYHGVYIAVSGHCPNYLAGWFLIAMGLIIIAIIVGCIVA